MSQPLRVLHCPEVVGGMPGELARAERALGADSRAVAFENSVYDYPIDEVLYKLETGRLKREWKRWGLLRRALTQFDVIHFNIDYLHFPSSRLAERPSLTTLHGRLDLPDLVPLYRRFPDMPLVSISDAQRKPLAFAHWVATVHHGLPAESAQEVA